ncbi:MAG TPA: hypothetical protein VGX03_00145 [Candidatus Binatia bacterium]|nr:hypothetical protein [Candidatus Binatia bacterium]
MRCGLGAPTERFSPALCPPQGEPGATVPGCDLRAPGIAPEAPWAWAGAAYKIPIAKAAGLVMPSNQGMKLTSGRLCSPARGVCSLRFAAARRMVAALSAAAYP